MWIRNWFDHKASINLSLGDGKEYSNPCNDTVPAITDLISNLTGQNASVVAASGNEGFTDGISWPACISNVISVGSTNKQDEHSSFSNASIFLDLVAPGENITSSIPGGFGNQYDQDSGTSYAAPHVAGTIALMRQAHSSPSIDVRHLLRSTADQVGGMGNNSFTPQYGHGRLNARAAVTEAMILSSFMDVYQFDYEIDDERNQFYPIYVLEDATLTVTGTLNLYDNFYVLGTLEGNGCIELFGGGAIIDTHGENLFPSENFGDCDVEPEPVYPTVSDTTFTQSTVLADTLKLTGLTTLEPGVTVTVAENNLIVVADTLEMGASGSTTAHLVVEGRLIAEPNASLSGIRLTVANGGELVLRDDVSLDTDGSSLFVSSDGQLTASEGFDLDMNGGMVNINGQADFGEQFSMSDGSISGGNSSELRIGSNSTLTFSPPCTSFKCIAGEGSLYSRGSVVLEGGLS